MGIGGSDGGKSCPTSGDMGGVGAVCSIIYIDIYISVVCGCQSIYRISVRSVRLL